jgi:hypothetical protein
VNPRGAPKLIRGMVGCPVIGMRAWDALPAVPEVVPRPPVPLQLPLGCPTSAVAWTRQMGSGASGVLHATAANPEASPATAPLMREAWRGAAQKSSAQDSPLRGGPGASAGSSEPRDKPCSTQGCRRDAGKAHQSPPLPSVSRPVGWGFGWYSQPPPQGNGGWHSQPPLPPGMRPAFGCGSALPVPSVSGHQAPAERRGAGGMRVKLTRAPRYPRYPDRWDGDLAGIPSLPPQGNGGWHSQPPLPPGNAAGLRVRVRPPGPLGQRASGPYFFFPLGGRGGRELSRRLDPPSLPGAPPGL